MGCLMNYESILANVVTTT